MNWVEAKQMCAVATEHRNQVNMVCPSPFRVRWERSVKQVLASPSFGALQSVAVYSRSGANVDPNQISWRERIEYSGLNILQVGIFAETLNAWCGEYSELLATTEIPLAEKIDGSGQPYVIRVPQKVHIKGQLRSGAAIDEIHNGLHTGSDYSEILLFGEEKTCKVNLLAGQVVLLQKKGNADKQLIDATGDPWEVEAEFIQAIRSARRHEPRNVRPDFFEAAAYMHKMQAIHDSAATGQPVELRV
jgi:hypothetical protein